MKTVFVLAIVAVGLAAAVKYDPPKLPCAYSLKIIDNEAGKSEELLKVTINGRYLRMKVKDDTKRDSEDLYVVYRPDIQKEEKKKTYIGIGATKDKKCDSDWIGLDEYLLSLKTVSSEALFAAYKAISWDDRDEDGKYDGKKCTVYTSKALNTKLYVRDDYPYAVVQGDSETKFDWEWSAPMSKFKLDDCDNDFGKTPSSDYVFCAASSVKVAVVALLVALVSALF